MDAAIAGYGRIRCSLDTGDEVEALQRARERKAFPDRYFGTKAESTVEGYLEHQRKRGVSKARIDHARTVLNELALRAPKGALEHLPASSATAWWADLLRRIAPKSAKDYLSHAKMFFRWAVDIGRVRSSPVALIVPPKIRPKPRRTILAPEQAIRVLDECKDDDLKFALYCALHCGLHCGLRKGEVIASRPHWFDLKANTVHVLNDVDWVTKDRDNRTIPLTGEFKKFLEGYGLRKPYMFRPDVEKKETNRTWRYRTDFKKAYDNHMGRLRITGVTFHDLRRTFASLLVQQGVSIFKVAEWLGDDVEVVQETYAHLLPSDPQINDPWNAAGGVTATPAVLKSFSRDFVKLLVAIRHGRDQLAGHGLDIGPAAH